MSGQASATNRRTLLLLSSIRKIKRLKFYTIHSRTVPVPLLCYITKGKGTITANGTSYAVEPFQLFYMAPGMHLEAAARTKEIEYYVIILEAVTASKQRNGWKLQPTAGFPPVLPEGRLYIRDTKQLHLRFEELHQSVQNGITLNQQEPDLQLQALVDFIARDISKSHAEQIPDNGIDSCISYMHRHYHEKITRETLAEIAKLTPNAFCRSFKRVTQLSPTDYLNGIRINEAKERLTPNGSIKDVAVTVGYGSEYYFSRIFKETVGISPSLFIKRERLKVATASRTCFHDNLAAVGTDVAAGVDCYRYPWMDEAEYKRILSSQLEQLRLVKPDLIIGDFFHQSLSEALKQIAPTVILEHHLDWRVIHMKIAELVGREKEAFESFRQLDERTLESGKMLRAALGNETVTLMQVIQQGIRIQGAVNHPLNELLYTELGLNPGNAVAPNKMREELLPEQLPHIESDHLFVIKSINHPEVEAALTKLQQTRSWNLLQAVLNDKIQIIPNWLLMSWTPPGRNKIITNLVEMLVQ